jgi:hypothetical protein
MPWRTTRCGSVLTTWTRARSGDASRRRRAVDFSSVRLKPIDGLTGTAGALHDQRKRSLGHQVLFDRCADMRRQRTTTRHPGRPSDRFVLRGIVRCERCEGRMHGQTSGKKSLACYYCSTRRKRTASGCNQPLAPAGVIEQQIAEFVACFTPTAEVRDEVLARLADEDTDTARRRKQLTDRRKRLRDLYEMGDLSRAEYASKRDAIDAELDSLAPGPTADIEGARAVLEDFGRFGRRSPIRPSGGS